MQGDIYKPNNIIVTRGLSPCVMVVGRDGDVDFTNLRFCLVTCRKVVPKSQNLE